MGFLPLAPAADLRYLTWPVVAGPLALAPGESLKLRVLVDRSVIEVFANDRQAITRRFYPSADSLGIKAFSTGGDSQLAALHFWEMMPSNPY